MYGHVETIHLESWLQYVRACRILCKYDLSTHDIQLADAFLLRFCTKVEQLFGSSSITPNMHLHGHLKEDIHAFGPIHAFWLFAYETFNGILGSYPNNNKSIESQLMKKFCKITSCYLLLFPKNSMKNLQLVPFLINELTLPVKTLIRNVCVSCLPAQESQFFHPSC